MCFQMSNNIKNTCDGHLLLIATLTVLFHVFTEIFSFFKMASIISEQLSST